AQMQHTQNAMPADHREVANRSDAFGYRESITVQLASVQMQRLSGSEHDCRCLVLLAHDSLADNSLATREIERIESQGAVLRVGQRYAHAVALHDVSNVRGNIPKKLPQIEVRHYAVGQIEKQLQAILRDL